jgi:hypothetical protein
MSTLFDINDIGKTKLPEIPKAKDAKPPEAENPKPEGKEDEPAEEKEEPEVTSMDSTIETQEEGDEDGAEEDTDEAEENDEDGAEEDADEAEDNDEGGEEKEEIPEGEGDKEEKPSVVKKAKKTPDPDEDEEEKEPPRDPYEWGKCHAAVIIRILKTDGNPKGQLVRIGVNTHDNPTEPPKIASFRIADLPHPLPDTFWTAVAETANELIEAVVKEFPDRAATWKANKEHKRDPKPYVHKKTVAGKSAARKKDKPKPPSIANTMSLFGKEEAKKKGDDNA